MKKKLKKVGCCLGVALLVILIGVFASYLSPNKVSNRGARILMEEFAGEVLPEGFQVSEARGEAAPGYITVSFLISPPPQVDFYKVIRSWGFARLESDDLRLVKNQLTGVQVAPKEVFRKEQNVGSAIVWTDGQTWMAWIAK